MADVRVSLTGGQISVDKNKVSVSKAAGETVTWQSNDGQFGIVFASGSGLTDPAISQQGGKWVGTAGPFPNSPLGTVKYDVTSPGLTTLDPDLDIKP